MAGVRCRGKAVESNSIGSVVAAGSPSGSGVGPRPLEKCRRPSVKVEPHEPLAELRQTAVPFLRRCWRCGTAPASGVPIAGGTDLLLDLEQGRHSPAHTLVDLTSVAEMTATGAARRRAVHRRGRLADRDCPPSAGVRSMRRRWWRPVTLIGGPQVRNVATLGGNVAHALPAADGTIALLALDADGRDCRARRAAAAMPLGDVLRRARASPLSEAGQELLVGFHVPLEPRPGGLCFQADHAAPGGGAADHQPCRLAGAQGE